MEELQRKLAEQEEAARRSEAAYEQLLQGREAARKALEAQKARREAPVSPEFTESETRKHLIDLALREAGWDTLHEGRELEYPVAGMPVSRDNPRGKGFVDYVLWDVNGLPLALIEAKRTARDPENGKRQARLYADCLEAMHGRRPGIFYTNGYRTYLWDDAFYSSPRRVHGFYTRDELSWLIQQRTARKDLRQAAINTRITGRPYQIEGIKRFAESLVTREVGTDKLRGTKRRGLLVMATGSGKTRVSASIVDLLMRNNWIRRVLFLADRNALVTQAKNAYAEHLPELSSVDLTQEKESKTTRLVFSTYQTIINRIDGERSEEGRFYGIGHFDLIIVYEAHRSVYNKYGVIFEYFDALLLGLTATPKKEIDHNTYELFDCTDGNPTFAYELEDAVRNGYLVPYRNVNVSTRFLREGIKYKDLSEAEKERYEEEFRDEATGTFPEHIHHTALNKWLFNKDTVDKVLGHLMERGLKIEEGDKIGRSIIFAVNHKHAEFILERFEKRYPQYPSGFMEVIHNQKSHAHSAILAFCDPHKENFPQIAVSVDMMDTGIDAPRVLNLVFFKVVRSYAKFWQMIGRGTRLCPDVYGPGKPKEYFLIFDLCGNFEFFNEELHQKETALVRPITQRIFLTRLAVARLLMESGEEDDRLLAGEFLDQLHGGIENLDRNRFDVQMKREHVDAFQDRDRWNHLDEESIHCIETQLSHLPVSEAENLKARQFDLMMLKMMQARLLLSGQEKRYHLSLLDIAEGLSKKYSVPQVLRAKPLIEALRDPDFYKELQQRKMEEIRRELRELVQYLDSEGRHYVVTDFGDDMAEDDPQPQPYAPPMTQELYRKRVERFIREHQHHLTISKLRTNQPITEDEILELQRILFDGGERGTYEQYREVFGNRPLGAFIRSIIGLDIQAANDVFAEFLQAGNLNADQQRFIDNIIQHLTRNGTIDKAMLFQSPFTDRHQEGLIGLFDEGQTRKIIQLLDQVNQKARVG